MINGNIDEFVEKLSGNVKRKWNGWTNKKIPLGATNTQGAYLRIRIPSKQVKLLYA